MKKLITLFIILLSVKSYSQDSVLVTINGQNRDWEYIGSLIYADNILENVFDSVKAKYRVVTPPSGPTTAVSVTSYTIDWVLLMNKLKSDPTALKSGTTGRIETLLRGVSQPYLTGKLDDFDSADASTFISMRIFGRLKLRRQ